MRFLENLKAKRAAKKAQQKYQRKLTNWLQGHVSFCISLSICLFLQVLMVPSSNALSWQEEMLNRVNKIRIENGATSLRICKPLQIAAQRYSTYMARENFLAHKGKDGSTVGSRLTSAGYLWKTTNSNSFIGENIAAGQKTVAEVVMAWTKSPSHFKNIISKNFTHVGFGRSNSDTSKYGIYWVQNFGSGVKC